MDAERPSDDGVSPHDDATDRGLGAGPADEAEREAAFTDASDREDVRLVGSSTRDEIYAQNVSTAGSTNVSGDVDAITADCKGSTSIRGDLRVREFSAAGSTDVGGDATVESWHSAGSTDVSGDLTAETVSTAGSFDVTGELTAEDVSLPGSASVGELRAQVVTSAGSLSAERVHAGTFDAAGALDVDRLVATEVDVRLGGTESSVGTVEAEEVRIRPGENDLERPGLDLGGLGNLLGDVLARIGSPNGDGRFHADRISGDTVELEGVTADVVEGRVVSLGPDCAVGTVRAEELERHDGAAVERFEEPEPAS